MRRLHPVIKSTSLLAVGLLYLPMLAVAAYSFNRSRLGASWQGFTLHWYAQLFNDPLVLRASLNTFILAIVSATIATVLGTTLAIGIDRFPWAKPIQRALDTILHFPVVMPDIIFAAALLVIFHLLHELTAWFSPGLFNMIIAHVTFEIAFVALIVRARITTLDERIEEAARDLYASTGYILRRILLPLLTPAILGGFLLAFTLSIDDFVVSFFTSGPDSTTLPLYIYGALKRGISPELHALAIVVFVATVMLVLLVQLLVRDPRGAAVES